jgi:hypothetical protein
MKDLGAELRVISSRSSEPLDRFDSVKETG